MAFPSIVRQRGIPIKFQAIFESEQMVGQQCLQHCHPTSHSGNFHLLRLSHLHRSLLSQRYSFIYLENIEITKTIMDDFNDWGISKIKGEKNFSQSALTDYSKLLNSTL